MPNESFKYSFALRIVIILFVFQTLFALGNQVKASVGRFVVADTILISEIEVNADLIKGSLKSVTGSLSVLNEGQIGAHDQVTISQQLNSLPGVYMHAGTFNTNRIVIRGIGSRTPYSSNRIRAYLNDIPLTNGDGVTTLEDIDVSRLGRIEIMKGPNSALYGSGLGGTIKLMTNTSESIFDAGIKYGSFNTRQLNLVSGFRLGKTKATTSLHQTHSDGFRENNRYDRWSGFLTGQRKWDKVELNFTLFMVNMNAQIPSSIDWLTFQSTPEKAATNWLNAGGWEENKRLLAGLTIRHQVSEHLATKTTLFTGAAKSFEHRPFNDLSDQSMNIGLRSQLMLHYKKVDFINGIELFSEQYHWATSLDKDDVFTALANVDENRNYANIFALGNYRPVPQLRLSAGLNLNSLNYSYSGNDVERDNFSYPLILSPRFGLNYEASASFNFYGSLGHGFSPPSLEETLMPSGEKNAEIKPETGWMSELGIRFVDSQHKWFVDACVYTIGVKNLLLTKRITEEIFMGINAGKTHHTGVEIQANYSFFEYASFPGSLSLMGALTISENRFVNFIDDEVDYTGNHLPGIPSGTVFVGLDWQPTEKLMVNMNQNYFGSQFMNDANSDRYSSYSVLNLNTAYSFSVGAKLNSKLIFGVNNLLNKNYASMLLVNAPVFGGQLPRSYYPGLPRNFYISLSFQI
ncbi:MAG: TonB-dependent receptor [Prolixibacteraceae bacterium]